MEQGRIPETARHHDPVDAGERGNAAEAADPDTDGSDGARAAVTGVRRMTSS
jgi:hypothetical protein